MTVTHPAHSALTPQPRAMLELIKPITWFPPMWACPGGIISAGVSPRQDRPLVAPGVGWFLGPWGFAATVVGVLAAGAGGPVL